MSEPIPAGRAPRLFRSAPGRMVRGAGLIEVMVAVLVFSLGFLGLAGMQLLAHQANHDALQATRANALARDMLARLRRNPAQADAYRVEGLGSARHEFSPVDCGAGSCTPAQLAEYDLARWQRVLRGEDLSDGGGQSIAPLVAGRACIRGSGGLIRLVLSWRGLSPAPFTPAPEDGSPCAETADLYGEGGSYRRILEASTWLQPV